MSDSVFDQVRLDTFEASAGTPKVPEDGFSGIRIAMPERVPVSNLAKLPLCGVWAFDGETMAKFPAIEESLVFMARNVQTHETATGNFRRHEDPATGEDAVPGAPSAPARHDEPPMIEPAAVSVRGYFNFDLGRPWKVPARPGRWRVTLVLHDIRSNTVEFEVVK